MTIFHTGLTLFGSRFASTDTVGHRLTIRQRNISRLAPSPRLASGLLHLGQEVTNMEQRKLLEIGPLEVLALRCWLEGEGKGEGMDYCPAFQIPPSPCPLELEACLEEHVHHDRREDHAMLERLQVQRQAVKDSLRVEGQG